MGGLHRSGRKMYKCRECSKEFYHEELYPKWRFEKNMGMCENCALNNGEKTLKQITDSLYREGY